MSAPARDDVDRLVREQLQLVLALDDLPSADARFAEDLQADSLDLVEAVEGVERALARRGITALLRDDVLRTLSTVRDAVDAVHEALVADTTASTAGQGGSTST